MPISRAALSTLLSVHLLCGAGAAAAGADPWRDARALRDRAIEAQRRGEPAVAASTLADAYRAAPQPCSSPALALLFEAVEAHVDAAALLDRRALCGFEELVEQASADQACAAHRADLAVASKDLERARRRAGGECFAAEPALRAPDDGIPLGITAPLQALRHESSEPSDMAGSGPEIPPPDSKRRTRRRVLGGVLLGAGIAASAATLAGLIRGIRLERQADRMVYDSDSSGCNLATGLSGACAALERQGDNMNRLAVGAGIAAAVFVVTGAVLLATSSRPRGAAGRAAIAAQGPGLMVRF